MEYMTVNEVAEKFKVSKQAVHKWINEGKLKVEKIAGTTIRIRIEEVEKLRR
jgi:excisionase family DNA binding protein